MADARRWLLVCFQGAAILLQGAILLPRGPALSPLAAVPLAAAGLSSALLLWPVGPGRLSAWLLVNVLSILGTLAVAGAEPAALLACLVTMVVGGMLRRLAYAPVAAVAVPGLFLLAQAPPAFWPAFPPYCLACVSGLLVAYGTDRLAASLEGYRQAVSDQQPLVLLGRVTQGLAHEFGNVLGGAQGLLEYAAQSRDPAEVRQALEVCARSLQRAGHIVENLKSFTREAPLERRPCDLAQVVADSLALIAPECRKARIEVVTEADPLPAVLADPARLQQVFLNLELNALRAMAPGGRLSVRLNAPDGSVRVAFADTGCGIGPEEIPRLFEPRFTTRADGGGLGLGLAVSRRIVHAHGGTIQVESAPGAGATFTVLLPRAP
jgi:signal transduction histidine kinase